MLCICFYIYRSIYTQTYFWMRMSQDQNIIYAWICQVAEHRWSCIWMQFFILIRIYIYTSILQDSHWFLWLSDVPVVCLSRPWQITRLTPWFFETLKNSVNQSMAPSMEIRLTGSHNGAMLLILFAAVMADPPSIGPLPSCHLWPSKRPSALLPTRRSPVCPVCWRHPSICSVKLYFNCLNNLHFFKAVKWNGADPLFQKIEYVEL